MGRRRPDRRHGHPSESAGPLPSPRTATSRAGRSRYRAQRAYERRTSRTCADQDIHFVVLPPKRTMADRMAQKLTGIFTPNLVPLDDRGNINEDELRRYIDWLIE